MQNKQHPKHQSLKDILQTINKNIIISFLIILIAFMIILGIVFAQYKNSEKARATEKLNATFAAFIDDISNKLIDIAIMTEFKDYLSAGKLTRKYYYATLIHKMHLMQYKSIAGMEIFDNKNTKIFSYGNPTKNSVTLKLCYLNRRIVNFKAGNCLHNWKIYFNQDVLIQELKKLDPEIVKCKACHKKIVSGTYFGDFPMIQHTNMTVKLKLKKTPSTILWEISISIALSLVFLVIWNINRIKKAFKKYLSDPLITITLKLKENQPLPDTPIAELSYLTKQIDQWKQQVIELEKIKAQERTTAEKTKTTQLIGASIAHELRTPIRSIISGVAGIEKFLPTLLESYNIAYNTKLLTKIIRPQQLELLKQVLINLKAEGTAANNIIDMLLVKIRETVDNTEIKKLSIIDCVNEAIQRYAFQQLEKNLITADQNNSFYFNGDPILAVHILFNLFKNALYYIAQAKKGHIYIYFETLENENRLHFKDTGKGISKEALPNIFERFYSKTEGGVGIGLSFCKMAMIWMGGDITCDSIENEYAEFILHFPKIKE